MLMRISALAVNSHLAEARTPFRDLELVVVALALSRERDLEL
jgi:hypothetical protein